MTDEEYSEIEDLKSEVAKLPDDQKSRELWLNAFPRGELLGLQLRLVQRRLDHLRSQLKSIEIDLLKRSTDRIAHEHLSFIRLLAWNLIAFLRIHTGGEIQGVDFQVGRPSLPTDIQNISNELSAAQAIILTQRKENRALRRYRSRPSNAEMIQIIDENRFINGNANFSKIGTAIGKTGETAKKWIEEMGLIAYSIPNNP